MTCRDDLRNIEDVLDEATDDGSEEEHEEPKPFKRPSFSHYLPKVDEDDPSELPMRFRLEDDRDEEGNGFLTISEEVATSDSDRAQVARLINAIDLDEHAARWLHAALTKALTPVH